MHTSMLALCLTLLGGVIHGPPSRAWATESVAVTDFRGKQIALQAPAQRIVCLIESALSGLYMLGAEAQIVGISTNVYQESTFPYYAAMDPRVRDKTLPTPGNWDFVNIESVVALRPDLVILWSHQGESIQALEEKGIPVYGVFIERFADIHRELLDLGALTGRGARATALVEYAQQTLQGIQQTSQALPSTERPKVYYMWAQGELETSGRPSTVDELIGLAGGQNVAGGIDQEHVVVNLENVLRWDPALIIMWPNTRKDPADIAQLPGWRTLKAVRDQQVHEFPDTFSCDLWTLKYLYAVRLVASWCYPAQLPQAELGQAQEGILRQLYGPKLTTLPPLPK